MARAVAIRRKLSTLTLTTCGIALLITTTVFLAGELHQIRTSNLQQLRTLSEAIGSNSTAALAFDNPEDAAAILSAFRSDPHIEVAALYKADGSFFAAYPPDAKAGALPAMPVAEGYRFESGKLTGVSRVREDSQVLGMLFVRSDMSAIYERLGVYALLAALVIALTLLVAWAIARRLQKHLSESILSLASTAEVVSNRHDYRVRATAPGITELDTLTGAFNHMLEQTEQSEKRLSAQVSRLALLQEITHSIGSRHDLLSIFQVVLGSIEEHLPIQFGCVCLHEARAGVMTVECVGPASGDFARTMGLTTGGAIPIGENGLYRALHGTLIHEPDLSDTTSPFPRRFADAGLLSLVLAPLALESSVFGVLVAARREHHAFSSADCEFLKQLSEHVALASHQAQLYGALQQAYDDLRQSQQTVLQNERLRALGQMASGIAHDINNAISPVSLYTELLLQQERQISEQGRARLATMQRAIEDVAGTIDRMREFYRPRESVRAFDRVDVHAAIDQVVDLTQPRWQALPQQRGIVIDLRRHFAAGKLEIMGDQVELRDALTNLLFNAVDAMPEGGTLTIVTSTRRLGDGLPGICIEVIDTGIGMDEETRRRCMEPFFTTKGERGTGLGLASVFGMLRRHDADFDIESAPGKGTTVRMIFPGVAAQAAGMINVAPAPAIRKNLRILVVDDDPVLTRSLQDALETDGHKLELAAGGQAGIEAFLRSQKYNRVFDLVITDLGMPRVDGRKVAEAIKSASPQTPVVLLTGWGQRLIDENDVPANIDRVLSKPPRLPQLRAAISDLVA
ncbi:MAG TPA: ATP-binding protein [Steroidobacteraceae bacterium]|nr:ATP-binding protein [Steroidobacteraceae bacterium]